MITDIKNGEYGIEGKTFLKLFNTEAEVVIDEETDISYAEKCVEAFNSLPDETISAIWEASKKYCLYMIDEWDWVGKWEEISEDMTIEVSEDSPAEEMKSCISPVLFIVDKPEDNRIGYHLECNCDWEPEHGLELTFLDGKLVYAGAFTDCNPWDEYDEEEEWNFVNSI